MKKIKKGISVFLIFCMLLPLLPAMVFAADNISYARDELLTMEDVTPDDWFFPYVSFVRENNIMQGTSETTFSPNQGFTRAQVAATLFRIHFGRAADATDPRANVFTDVPENEWFAPYITWANANNIVSGIGNNLFAPADNITRQQFAAMLHRFAESFTSLDTAARQSTEWNNFTDRNQIADWAVDGLMWGILHGIISGRTTTILESTGVVTRADVAAMLTRFIRHMRNAETVFSADDFELTVTVEEITSWHGNVFRVDAELKNNSGSDLVISIHESSLSTVPARLGRHPIRARHLPPMSKTFEAGSVIREGTFIGSEFEPGTHEVKILFRLDIRLANSKSKFIEVLSDPISLTVSQRAFGLTISAEETTLPQGENFKINVELRNNSGEDYEIFHSALFWPHISGRHLFGNVASNLPETYSRLFEANSVIRNIDFNHNEIEAWFIGADLEPGTHELRFTARFWLHDRRTSTVYSNIITLIVE